MTASTLLKRLSDELERGISLLEQLHVLSQTEALALETSSLTDLPAIVASKETVVEQIRQSETQIARALAEVKPSWPELGGQVRSSLLKLQDDAFLLLEKIQKVEDENRTQLEKFKGEFATSLLILHEGERLNEAYGNPAAIALHFSRIVD